MRNLLFLLLSLTPLSCHQNTSNSNVTQSNSLDSTISNNKDIFGKWMMCSTSGNGMVIQMNVCPSVTFNINGTGWVETNSVITEHFSWILKNSGLKIFYRNKIPNSSFPDTFYYADFNKQKDRTDLTLTHYDHSYYLSK